MEGLEESGVKIVNHLLARYFLNDGGAHIGAKTIVKEERARFVLYWPLQEGFDPVNILTTARWLYIVTARHRQQVAYGHRLQIFTYLDGELIWEEINHFVC